MTTPDLLSLPEGWALTHLDPDTGQWQVTGPQGQTLDETYSDLAPALSRTLNEATGEHRRLVAEQALTGSYDRLDLGTFHLYETGAEESYYLQWNSFTHKIGFNATLNDLGDPPLFTACWDDPAAIAGLEALLHDSDRRHTLLSLHPDGPPLLAAEPFLTARPRRCCTTRRVSEQFTRSTARSGPPGFHDITLSRLHNQHGPLGVLAALPNSPAFHEEFGAPDQALHHFHQYAQQTFPRLTVTPIQADSRQGVVITPIPAETITPNQWSDAVNTGALWTPWDEEISTMVRRLP